VILAVLILIVSIFIDKLRGGRSFTWKRTKETPVE
jgi:hypothetical protein